MEIINNPSAHRKEIELCIRKNGFAPEHNFGYWMWLEEKGRENFFLKFPDKEGILAQFIPRQNYWFFVSSPIAGEQNRIKILVEAVAELFRKDIRKINIELDPASKRIFSREMKKLGFRIGSSNYIYHWPVFDMAKWDGLGLKGRKWKKLRNINNRFYRQHRVKIVDARKLPKGQLKGIVNDWIKRRTTHDLPFFQRYLNMIDHGFDGVLHARSMVVNGQPCSITAGWKIPNSRDYYSGIGIYNYKAENIGEASNLDDLLFLKKKSFRMVDFGGGGKNLTAFKMKFKPTHTYKTYSFPVMKV